MKTLNINNELLVINNQPITIDSNGAIKVDNKLISYEDNVVVSNSIEDYE